MALSASFSTSASALQVYINTNDATLYVRYVSLKNCLLSQIVLPAAVPTHYLEYILFRDPEGSTKLIQS